MKNLMIAFIALVLLTTGCGCEENSANSSSTSGQDRKARLIAQENIELKNRVEQLENQLQTQKQEQKDCEQRIEQVKLENAKNSASTLEFLGELSKQVSQLQEENEQLKQKLNMEQ